MHSKSMVLLIIGTVFMLMFSLLSYLIRDTVIIWLQTRAFGLLAYLFLFASVAMGEIRLLTKGKSDFKAFKYHPAISAFAIFLVLTHFTSAVLDNYKWERQVSLTQYLGFSFSDKWLALLSFGTLAFYLMVLVGFTSSHKNIKLLGFHKWKFVHYASYIAFFLAFVHAVKLGTDMKTSALHYILYPLTAFSMILVAGLLVTRIFNGFVKFPDQIEVALTAAFFILLLLLSAIMISDVVDTNARIQALYLQLGLPNSSGKTQEYPISQAETITGFNNNAGEVTYGNTV